VRENLFVPFYTTRRNGSGIGLSLSRHIIHNHKGRIEVKTREGAGSEFIIYL
jgi:signal transduction histidine kinase